MLESKNTPLLGINVQPILKFCTVISSLRRFCRYPFRHVLKNFLLAVFFTFFFKIKFVLQKLNLQERRFLKVFQTFMLYSNPVEQLRFRKFFKNPSPSLYQGFEYFLVIFLLDNYTTDHKSTL